MTAFSVIPTFNLGKKPSLLVPKGLRQTQWCKSALHDGRCWLYLLWASLLATVRFPPRKLIYRSFPHTNAWIICPPVLVILLRGSGST